MGPYPCCTDQTQSQTSSHRQKPSYMVPIISSIQINGPQSIGPMVFYTPGFQICVSITQNLKPHVSCDPMNSSTYSVPDLNRHVYLINVSS
jgi:hypothetical protein